MIDNQEAIAKDLHALIRGDVHFDPITRRLYATDAGLSQIEPLGVVYPRDTEDVARLVSYAAEKGLSVVPRGMGSGLNGGAVGPGIQIDFTRYMNAILEVAPDASWVRVQPGVVKAVLDRYVRKYGVFFAPDPSSENHCSLGGMIGTNASGARTVAYGATKDHVLALQVVLADGSVFEARPYALESTELAELLASRSAAGQAFASVLPRLIAERDELMALMPDVVKNSCGYRIEAILDDGTQCSGAVIALARERAAADGGTTAAESCPTTAQLQRLFVGAEGTLGVVTEATLRLVPLPACRGVAMVYFPSVFAVGEAVPEILALGPTAVEIMDSRFLALVRKHDRYFDSILPECTDTALLIEFEGQNQEEVDEKFAALRRHLDNTQALSMVRARTQADTDYLWKIRRTAVALIQRNPGPKQPLPFMEDIAVHPRHLAASIDFIQKILDREGVEAIMVGHVGDGNIHTRPVLDPRDPQDRQIVRRIYDQVSAHVLELRGTMAGEHGDGLIHTPRLREMYGERIYDLFVDIKKAFDPQGILNPGKKVGPQGTADDLFAQLRYGPEYRTLPQKPLLRFEPRGYESEIERCHGCAACKSQVATTMCPVYKATRLEHASPRAKANLLRGLITGSLVQPGKPPEDSYGQPEFKVVFDYCIECGMCAVECPSAVNIPKLMLEAKSQYRQRHPLAFFEGLTQRAEVILSRVDTLSRIGCLVAPLANLVVSWPAGRKLAERLLGIDRRRPLPRFARPTYERIARERRQTAIGQGATGQAPTRQAATGKLASGLPLPDPEQRTAVYFADLYANYNDPALSLAVERILAAHGVRLVFPRQKASGIPQMLYGYAKRVRRVARANLRALTPWVRAGAVVISGEPTATFALKTHYADYLQKPECAEVAQATYDLGEFLKQWRTQHPEKSPVAQPISHSKPLRIAYHQPCHLKAQNVGSPALELLREIPGVEVVDLAAGCCGMAGTFGMKLGTYDFSLQIGEPLFSRIAEVDPDLVVSECSTCRMQLSHVTGRPCMHPALLLAQAYGV